VGFVTSKVIVYWVLGGQQGSQSLKFLDGGTHRRYETMRQWFIKEGEWCVQDRAVPHRAKDKK